jgi:hypothetical protein
MKLLSYTIFIVFVFHGISALGQQTVMVGDTVVVYTLTLPYKHPVYGCYYSSISYESIDQSVDFSLYSEWPYPIVVSAHPHQKGIVTTTFAGDLHDTHDCKPDYTKLKEILKVEGIDSMTTLRIVYPTVVQQIDTSAYQYLQNNIGAFFSMYNNVSDSSTFSNWQLVVSDSAKLSFKIDTGGTELFSYLMEPFTRKRQLNFTFTTELTPIETELVFPAKLFTTVTTAGKDSVYENTLLFRFPPLQPKGIHGITSEDEITVSISPNPTQIGTALSFGHNKTEAILIELYDILGNQRMKLADGTYPSGVHIIPINTKDLPHGSYFVRLQTSGQVLTKKLIVQ